MRTGRKDFSLILVEYNESNWFICIQVQVIIMYNYIMNMFYNYLMWKALKNIEKHMKLFLFFITFNFKLL